MTVQTLSEFNVPDLADFFKYLDGLRKSGRTNMFGAGAYLRDEFGLTKAMSGLVLQAWMNTFDGTSEPAARAKAALSQEEAA